MRSRSDLKTDIEDACLMFKGSSFHSCTDATTRSPLSFRLVLGTLRRSWSADLRDREGAH